MKEVSWRESVLPFISLFASASTLLCCALPALLVSLGLGSVMAGLVTSIPQIVWVSEHKGVVFALGGFLLVVAATGMYLSRNAPCPVDPVQARYCATVRRLSRVILSISVLLYLVGFFFAYLAADLLL